MFDDFNFDIEEEKVNAVKNRIRVAYVLTLDNSTQEIASADIIDIKLPVKEEIIKTMIVDEFTQNKKAHVLGINILSIVDLKGLVE